MKTRQRREQNANGSMKMKRENEEMLVAMKDLKTMTSFESFSELSSIFSLPPSDSNLTNDSPTANIPLRINQP